MPCSISLFKIISLLFLNLIKYAICVYFYGAKKKYFCVTGLAEYVGTWGIVPTPPPFFFLFSYNAGVREDSLFSCAHQYKIYAS